MSGRKYSLCFGTVNTDRAKRDRKKLHGNARSTELFILKKVLYLRGQDLTLFVELNDRDALLCKCCLSLLSTVKRCDEELNRTLAQIHSKLNVVHAFPPVSSSMAPVIPQIVPPVDPRMVTTATCQMVPPVAPQMAISTVPRMAPSVAPHTMASHMITSEESPVSPCILSPVISPVVPAHNTPIGHSSSIRRSRD